VKHLCGPNPPTPEDLQAVEDFAAFLRARAQNPTITPTTTEEHDHDH
jgi:hypothetical protein